MRDKLLLRPKILYFTINMMAYAVHTLQAQYLVSEWQLSMQQVGYLSALMGVNFFGAIGWSRLADRTGHHKRILLVTAVLYSTTYSALLLPWFKDGGRGVFIALVLSASNMCYSALFPLLDSRILTMLEAQGCRESFGRQRVWGTIGHALITVLSTEAVEQTSMGFAGMFVLLGVCTGMFVLALAACVPAHPQHTYMHLDELLDESDLENCHRQSAMFKSSGCGASAEEAQRLGVTRSLLMDGRFLSLLVLVLSSGYTRAIMSYFQPYYVAIVLQKGNRFVSLAIAGRVVSESAFYYFAHEVHSLIGAEWMLLVGQIAGLVRVGGYAFLPASACTFPVILGLELFKGASTSLTMTSAVLLANDLAPPGGQSTAQGIYSGVWQGASMALGGVLGAALIAMYPDDNAGLHGLFRISFATTSLLVALYLVRGAAWSGLRYPVTGTGFQQ